MTTANPASLNGSVCPSAAMRISRSDTPAAMAFRREVWNDAGPLDEQFRFYCQDIELCLRATERGWRVRVVDNAHVTHGLGKTIGGKDTEKLRDDLLAWGKTRYGRAWWLAARVILGVFRRT